VSQEPYPSLLPPSSLDCCKDLLAQRDQVGDLRPLLADHGNLVLQVLLEPPLRDWDRAGYYFGENDHGTALLCELSRNFGHRSLHAGDPFLECAISHDDSLRFRIGCVEAAFWHRAPPAMVAQAEGKPALRRRATFGKILQAHVEPAMGSATACCGRMTRMDALRFFPSFEALASSRRLSRGTTARSVRSMTRRVSAVPQAPSQSDAGRGNLGSMAFDDIRGCIQTTGHEAQRFIGQRFAVRESGIVQQVRHPRDGLFYLM
jgi:hypothetical protein